MKKLYFLIFVGLFLNFSNSKETRTYSFVEAEILVDDKPWQKRQTIDEESIITVQLKGLKKGHQYNLEKVKVQWVLERQKVGRKNKKKLKRNFVGKVKTFNVQPKRRMTTQEGLAICYDCDEYDLAEHIEEYQGFSDDPRIVFPYKEFYDPCLSRVILRIANLQVKLPNGKIQRVRDFAYKKDFSLRPRWSRCDDVDYNYPQGWKK